MNKEYIERETCLKEFKELKPANWDNTEYEKQILANYNFYRSIVENAPAADVTPVVHGMWIFINEATNFYEPPCGDTYKCSECQYIIDVADTKFNFCPNCGARMDGGIK